MTSRLPAAASIAPSRRASRVRRTGLATAALALLLGAALPVSAQDAPPVGRVISTSPIQENGQPAGYSVTYEYAGRQYTTRTDAPPGPTIPVQVGGYGVTTYPVAPQPAIASNPEPAAQPAAPYAVTPEPGVVVSGNGVPYGAPAPVYPAAYPAPVYVAPAYAYPAAPYVYPPVGLSLNFGYSRGWHHGWR
ncbi:MAG: hypothetical protein REJ24_06170 [Rhodocyclaceae bacterium]|nr:hypothetical protein [Pseudomonadota bacterium]MDQ7972134.1 hypothetical protein [Rhodocyclaceae bacterium]MDQ7998760.1 hypothetical protein [Pseudomonadota bacterium]MDQ8016548.1 hypothetical protein [Pseudomonadota bacterium]